MIVIDANVMASALMGRSLPLLAGVASRVAVVAPEMQFDETRQVLIRRGIGDVDAGIAALLDIIAPIDAEAFAHFEQEALVRLHDRGRSDWPVLAAALAFGAPIWSNDRDFFGVGVAVWSSWNMRNAATDWADPID